MTSTWRLKQEILNIMNKNSLDLRLNKLEIQLTKIEKINEQINNKFCHKYNWKNSRKLKYKR